MSKIFTQIPEELFNHFLWQKATDKYKIGLLEILRMTSFADQPKIKRKKGQVQIRIREFSRQIDVPPTTAYHIVRYWMGFTTHGKQRGDMPADCRPILLEHKVEQEVEQEFCLYNVLLTGYYEIGETVSGTENGTQSGTEVEQRWNSAPRENANTYIEAKKMKEITTTSAAEAAHDADVSFDPIKAKAMLFEFWKAWKQTKAQQDNYLKKGISHCFAALTYITDPGFEIKTTAIQAFVWAFKDKPWTQAKQPKKLSNQDLVKQYFTDGEAYAKAICCINANGISFHRGMKTGGAKFDDKSFQMVLGKVLDDFGIQNPLKKTINIKEA